MGIDDLGWGYRPDLEGIGVLGRLCWPDPLPWGWGRGGGESRNKKKNNVTFLWNI